MATSVAGRVDRLVVQLLPRSDELLDSVLDID